MKPRGPVGFVKPVGFEPGVKDTESSLTVWNSLPSALLDRSRSRDAFKQNLESWKRISSGNDEHQSSGAVVACMRFRRRYSNVPI